MGPLASVAAEWSDASRPVGIGLADDIRALKLLHPFEERSTLDLGTVARDYGLRQTGVRNLAGIFMKIRITKGIKTSNWAAPKLSAAQIRYAATDAWICRELFLQFRNLGMIPDARSRLTSAAAMRFIDRI